VTAGYYHSLYLKSDGSLWAMGSNGSGQLGDGSITDRVTPVEIESSGVASVTAGSYHSLYLKSDGSLWAMGRNNYGQLGDGSADSRTTPVLVLTGSTYRLVLNASPEGGGGVAGDGAYAPESNQTIVATANPGYLFSAWSGGVNSVEASLVVTMTDDLEINATFVPDRNDDDGDGLSNYTEIVLLDTNATNSDTDGDGFSDYDENQTVGLDPLVANPSLYSYFASREQTARLAGKAEAQAELAQGGLSSLSYFQNVDLGQPYTSQWFYQPGMGWLWTSKESFPFIYRAADQETGVSAGWLYLSQTADQTKISLYDYGTETWIFQDF